MTPKHHFYFNPGMFLLESVCSRTSAQVLFVMEFSWRHLWPPAHLAEMEVRIRWRLRPWPLTREGGEGQTSTHERHVPPSCTGPLYAARLLGPCGICTFPHHRRWGHIWRNKDDGTSEAERPEKRLEVLNLCFCICYRGESNFLSKDVVFT